MKSLKESLLSDMDDVLKSGNKTIKDNIKQWLKENLLNGASDCKNCKISRKANKDGKYEVSVTGDIRFKRTATSLTNGMFIWTEIDGSFCCDFNRNIKSLEGSPRAVEGNFSCYYCKNLKSLKGAPEKVGGSFNCQYCYGLKSLEGAPEKVGGSFNCDWCIKLTSLKGAPEKLKGNFSCNWCENLKSLEGVTKSVGRNFYCGNCGKKFKGDDVKKICDVKHKIIL